jgi:hypothetical protein
MSKCINISHPEFKKLLSETNLDTVSLHGAVSRYQTLNNTDRFPTVNEISELSEANIKPGVESVFQNNPELSEIGTIEEYSQYLDTVFPGSVTPVLFKGMRNKSGTVHNTPDHRFYTSDRKIADKWYRGDIETKAFISDAQVRETYKAKSGLGTLTTRQNEQDFINNSKADIIELDTFDVGGKQVQYVLNNKVKTLELGSEQDIQGFKDYISPKENIQESELKRKTEISNKTANRVIKSLLERLQETTGIPYNIISSEEMSEMVGEGPVPVGFVYKGEVYLNEDKLSMESAFHEYAHPFIEYIDSVNPELIYKFYTELSQDPEGQKVIRTIKSDPRYKEKLVGNDLKREGVKEAVVTMLGRVAENNFAELLGKEKLDKGFLDKAKDFMESVWKEIIEFLGLSDVFEPTGLGVNTTLSDLAVMMYSTDMRHDLTHKDFFKDYRNREEYDFLTDQMLGDHSKMTDEIRLFLYNRLQAAEGLKDSPVKSKRISEIKRLIQNVELHSSGVKKFEAVADYAYNEVIGQNNDGYIYKLSGLLTKLNSKDPKEALDALNSYGEFAKSFYNLFSNLNAMFPSILTSDDIQKEKADPGSPLYKMQKVINATSDIIENYRTQVIPIAAKQLEQYHFADEKSMKEIQSRIDLKRARIAEITKQNIRKGISGTSPEMRRLQAMINGYEKLKEKYMPGQQGLINQMKEASEDIGFFDRFIRYATSQSDIVLSSFANLVKTEMEKVRIRLLDRQSEVAKAFDEFKKSTGKSPNTMFVDAYNEGLYEKVKIYYNGQMMETARFTDEFDANAYWADYEQMKNEQERLTNEGNSREAKQVYFDFMARTHKPLDGASVEQHLKEWEDMRDSGQISQEEYEDYIIKSMYNAGIKQKYNAGVEAGVYDINNRYRLEAEELLKLYRSNPNLVKLNAPFVQIDKSKYVNKNYANLSAVHKKYLKVLVDQQKRSLTLLPESQRRTMDNESYGLLVGGIRKKGWERLTTSGFKETIKESYTELTSEFMQNDEEVYGMQQNLASENNEAYVQKMVPIYYTSPVEFDQISLDLSKSVLMFARMAEKYSGLNDLHSLTRAMEEISETRKVTETKGFLNEIKDKFAAKKGIDRNKERKGLEVNVNQALRVFIDMQVYGEEKKVEKGEILGYEINYGKVADWLSSFGSFTTIGGDILKAVANLTQAKIMEFIEVAGGEVIDPKSYKTGEKKYLKRLPDEARDYGKQVPETKHGLLVQYFDPLQGEVMSRYGEMLSKSDTRKVISSDTWFKGIHVGEHFAQVSLMYGMMEKQQVKLPNGNMIPLEEAYILKDGKLVLREGIDPEWAIGGKKMLQFVAKLHGINNRLHGFYNDFDKVEAQRSALGRMMLVYRKFAPPGFTRRFKRLGLNNETGMMDEGFYRTFWNEMLRERFMFWKILSNPNLTDLQKANVRRAFAEHTIQMMTIAAVIFAGAMGDDDKNKLENFAEYQAIRLNSEMFFWINPKDFLRIMSSPSASTTKIEQFVRAIDQTIFTWDPDKLEYSRKQGIWDKGDNKSVAYWLKFLGISGNNLNPEEAVKVLQFTR